MTCTQPDCDRRIKGRGLCSTHWQQARDRGDFTPTATIPLPDLIEDVGFMLETGESPALIAARLHTTTAALEKRLRRRAPELARVFYGENKRQRAGAA